jgi:LacI family transcriptional regulator
MLAHCITPLPAWQIHCRPQVEGGQSAAHELLQRAPELTVLLAYNDLVAAGALRACSDLGLRVPQDCAIIGCDDTLLAALVSPALTTIHIPTYSLGQQAMDLLLNIIEAGELEAAASETCRPPAPIMISAHLVIRDSTGDPVRRDAPGQPNNRIPSRKGVPLEQTLGTA